MNGSAWSKVAAAIEILALLVFTAATPLAHLHQGDRVPSGPRPHPLQHHDRGVLFHAHVEAHSDPLSSTTDGQTQEGETETIAHGKFDITRSAAVPQPPDAVALFGGDRGVSFVESLRGLSDPLDRAHGPPGRAQSPARAPPSAL